MNKYNSRKNEIIANRKTLYPGEDVIELLDLADLNLNKPEHVADVLDCQGEQEILISDSEACHAAMPVRGVQDVGGHSVVVTHTTGTSHSVPNVILRLLLLLLNT